MFLYLLLLYSFFYLFISFFYLLSLCKHHNSLLHYTVSILAFRHSLHSRYHLFFYLFKYFLSCNCHAVRSIFLFHVLRSRLDVKIMTFYHKEYNARVLLTDTSYNHQLPVEPCGRYSKCIRCYSILFYYI